MEVIYLHAPINITSVFTNFILLNHPQNLTLKLILERLDAFNGLMMTLVSFQVVGMEVSLCGNYMLTKTKEEMDNRKIVTQSLN